MEYNLDSLSSLPGIAQKFAEEQFSNKIFAFDGDMGAGKTTFITALLHSMGISDTEGSPTYSIVNTYDSAMFGKVYHYDVYRLKNIDEAYDIGMDEVLYGNGYVFIEWAEKIESLLPDETIWVYIRKEEDDSRIISVKA